MKNRVGGWVAPGIHTLTGYVDDILAQATLHGAYWFQKILHAITLVCLLQIKHHHCLTSSVTENNQHTGFTNTNHPTHSPPCLHQLQSGHFVTTTCHNDNFPLTDGQQYTLNTAHTLSPQSTLPNANAKPNYTHQLPKRRLLS